MKFLLFLLPGLLLFMACRQRRSGIPRVLVYTMDLHNQVSQAAVRAVHKLADINEFQVNVTDTSTAFKDDSLSSYAAVLFLNRPGVDLNPDARIALERFVEAGGGVAGIHGRVPTDNFKWYADMIGSTGKDGVSFIHQKYDGGRVTYTCDSLCAKNVGDGPTLKNVLNEVEYAIGHFEPLDYGKATAGK